MPYRIKSQRVVPPGETPDWVKRRNQRSDKYDQQLHWNDTHGDFPKYQHGFVYQEEVSDCEKCGMSKKQKDSEGKSVHM